MRVDRVIAAAVIVSSFAFTVPTATALVKPRYYTSADISNQITATWHCQDNLVRVVDGHVARTPRSPSSDPWKISKHAVAWRAVMYAKWKRRHLSCVETLHAREAVIRRLNAGLAGTPMAGTGRELEAAARAHDVNPALIAGIGGTESTFGEAACWKDGHRTFNAFGLASCGSWGRTPVPAFANWGEAYDFMGRYLTGKTSITSGWPWAQSAYDLHGYAKCSACWAAKTTEHMARFGLGTGFRYPDNDV